MCGRFEQDPEIEPLKSMLREVKSDLKYKANEIFPTNVALVQDLKGPSLMTWGLPRFNATGVIFNVRSETALDKKMFRNALLNRRIVIPTTGFYEWKTVEPYQKKQRFLFIEPHESVTWLAGFYNIFHHDNIEEERFTILTTQANEAMVDYHDRMPIVLHSQECQSWLDGSGFDELLSRKPFALEVKLS